MRHVARWALALALVFAGVSHLFWGRREFQAQVPDLTTKVLDKDAVVVASGVVEVMLGAALVVLPKSRSAVGAIVAALFVAVFPGNIEQYVKHRDGFGLDTDTKRLVRLFFQPALVAWAIWSTRTHAAGLTGRGRLSDRGTPTGVGRSQPRSHRDPAPRPPRSVRPAPRRRASVRRMTGNPGSPRRPG